MERVLLTSISVEELTSLIQQCIKEELTDLNAQPSREELITIDDVVKMFRISKVTLHEWKRKGILPYYRISRRIYFKLSELDAVLESKRSKSRKHK